MGKFDSILLLSDFDGTLTNSVGQVPQNNIDAIKYFISEGGKFSVSTGRTKLGFHNYSEELMNAPVILGNGAMAFDYKNSKTVFLNVIEKLSVEIINRIITDNPDIAVELYSVDDKVYVVNPNDESYRHFNGLKIKEFSVIDAVKQDMFPFVKIMLSTKKRTHEVQDYLKIILPADIKYIPTDGSYIEILAENAGKGKALLQLAECLSVSASKAYAIGDASNDVDMLRSASIGFVPSSGDKFALSVADVIVAKSDDGAVADAIKYLEELNIRK